MPTKIFGWLLGLKNVTSIDELSPSFAAPWAEGNLAWLVFGAVAIIAGSIAFYIRGQSRGSTGMRAALGLARGLVLALLFVTLADPVVRIALTTVQPPSVYLVFDGTDSMAIQDEYTDAQRRTLDEAVGRSAAPGENADLPSRTDYVRSLIAKPEGNLVDRLAREKKYRLEAFVFDGHTTSRLRKLEAGASRESLDPRKLSEQLSTDGQVTALGDALDDVGRQFGTGGVQAVVMFSDFAHNSGVAPLGNQRGREQSPASKLGVPVYTVGIGAVEAIDLGVDLQTDPKMKKAEKTNLLVKLQQSGLTGQSVNVRVTARPVAGGQEILVGERSVTLASAFDSVEFPFTPTESGRFEFHAEVQPLAGEAVEQNNRATRETNIIDDYLRLMYVANEPDWEWRFVKEVFHRDKLVGLQGFRTYLAASDPRVRESNVLFLPSMTPKRGEFFANDVIFLGDMPRNMVSTRFAEMVKEFVGQFGGGLVIIAGPQYGPKELQGTPLEELLPVLPDPDAKIRDEREFTLRLTPHAPRYPFMTLGNNEVETNKAWENLGPLPWYQPVAQVHSQATVLAEHPLDTCRDGKTRQPLIAIRQYGNGEVVYIACNELYRLRRKYGERYYRAFWSQLIYRLGMSHALGSEKRFVVRTDRQQYRAEERATLTIEAYDENFEPLTEEKLAGKKLAAELTAPGKGDAGPRTTEVPLSLLRPGVFEARIPVYAAGQYGLRVTDPVTNKLSEVHFDVTDVSAERRSAVRNVRLQESLAATTNGRSYELANAANLVNDLQLEPIVETYTRSHALWSTPLWFIAVVVLLLGEWLVRKLINLA